MAQPFKIDISEDITKAIKDFGEDAREEFEGEIQAAAQEWVELAAKSAPVDLGGLRGGISYYGFGLNWSVVSAAHYSAYIEWGTITRVEPPNEADLAAYAMMFKGAGIKKTGGMYARPFFFIHKDTVLNNLAKRLVR
jgi:hypothetical protein